MIVLCCLSVKDFIRCSPALRRSAYVVGVRYGAPLIMPLIILTASLPPQRSVADVQRCPGRDFGNSFSPAKANGGPSPAQCSGVSVKG